MQEVEVKLSDWVFNAIRAQEVLTLRRDYFRLRQDRLNDGSMSWRESTADGSRSGASAWICCRRSPGRVRPASSSSAWSDGSSRKTRPTHISPTTPSGCPRTRPRSSSRAAAPFPPLPRRFSRAIWRPPPTKMPDASLRAGTSIISSSTGGAGAGQRRSSPRSLPGISSSSAAAGSKSAGLPDARAGRASPIPAPAASEDARQGRADNDPCVIIPVTGTSWYSCQEETMPRNTSVSLGDHFAAFIDTQVQGGRYGSASDVVRAGLRLLEEHEAKVKALQDALRAGEGSETPQPSTSMTSPPGNGPRWGPGDGRPPYARGPGRCRGDSGTTR